MQPERPNEFDPGSSELHVLISQASQRSLRDAWRLAGKLSEAEIRQRSCEDRGTYLHSVVNAAPDVFRRYQTLTPLVSLVYRLAVRGVNVNAQNHHGNTCLHLACIKPHAEGLCSHLIRIGVDPCIQNKKKCRVIHTYLNHRCVLVKGQSSAKSGLWNAVEKEDLQYVEKLLKSWCRVNVRRNKSLKGLAEETANSQLVKLLARYEHTSELVCYALSGDLHKVKDILKSGKVDLSQRDEARDVPMPLVVAVEELGEVTRHVAKLLRAQTEGASGADSRELIEGGVWDSYQGGLYGKEVRGNEEAFEHSEFYTKIEEGTTESILEALDLIQTGQVNIRITSHQPDTRGWNYLHYVIDRYITMKRYDEEKARLLIRALYRLALAGIDVNVRDGQERTPLIMSSLDLDQNLMTHVIRIGGDPSLTDLQGRAVNEEVYEDKGKLVYDNKYRIADLPGLWVAVENNEISKAERWLKSWARVNTKKGDRRLLDVARAMRRKEIVRLLEEYEHINEFVCATFACDVKRMMDILALGKGENKVNTIDDFFHVGYTWDRHAEFMPRPIIIGAMELCTPEVVDFLLKFGADLSREHEECEPCGPVAFWAFRDHVNNENALKIAQHANVCLRDEIGCTMLHRAIQKNRPAGKSDMIQTLLDRGVNLAARDWEGSTARDYVTIHAVAQGDELRQIIDNHVLELAYNDQHYQLETYLLEGYDHVLDVRGTRKNKTAYEIAEVKEFKELKALLEDWDRYREENDLLHLSAQTGDLLTISKLSGEKRCAFSRDKAGRTLLHTAVLYEHPDIVTFLVEQFPSLINLLDNFNRTPLHLCVCLKERHLIWPILQDGGSDPNLVDVHNMSVYDYVRELETPTSTKHKPRGRRWRDYTPSESIEREKRTDYGVKALTFELHAALMTQVDKGTLAEVEKLTTKYKGADLTQFDLDRPLLKLCVDNKRTRIAKHLVMACNARAHCTLEIPDKDGQTKTYTLKEYCKKKELSELVDFIRTIPKPTPPTPTDDADGNNNSNADGDLVQDASDGDDNDDKATTTKNDDLVT